MAAPSCGGLLIIYVVLFLRQGLSVQPRIAWNSQTICPSLLSVKVTGVCHRAWLWCSFYACLVSTLTRDDGAYLQVKVLFSNVYTMHYPHTRAICPSPYTLFHCVRNIQNPLLCLFQNTLEISIYYSHPIAVEC